MKTYWINFSGQRVLYSTLGPGQSVTQPTYITHPWVVADSSDRCLAVYEPSLVTQAANICQGSVTSGGANTYVVTAASTCRWGAESNVAWIAITSGALGTGDGYRQ